MNSRFFGSDNYSGVTPEVMTALQKANQGHAPAYGNDIYTKRISSFFQEIFGKDTWSYPVYCGTGANVIALATCMQPHHAILCPETAHINVHETGAPMRAIGCRIEPIATKDGKLHPNMLKHLILRHGTEHFSQPKVISITQITELGTCYSVDEVKSLAEFAHENNMYLHMDGARIANAAVYLNKDIRSFTVDAGVDILSFGGTKNGMMFGDAVLFFNEQLHVEAKYIRKSVSQLASKMRFISAQFEAILQDNLWLKLAKQSNNQAQYLKQELEKLAEAQVIFPVEGNMLFVKLPPTVRSLLIETWNVYEEFPDTYRFVCSFDNTKEDTDALISGLNLS